MQCGCLHFKGHGPPASYQENAVRLSASQRSRSTCISPGECSAAVCISKVTVHLHLTRRMQCGCLHLKGHGPPASYQENAVRLSASQRSRSTCILPGECSAAVCISKVTVHLHLTRRMQCGCLHLKGHGPPASYQENAVRLSASQRSRSTCILPGECSAAVCISKVTVHLHLTRRMQCGCLHLKGHGPPASYQENAVRLSASQRSRSTCILPGECSAAVCISKVTVHLHLTRRMQCGCLHLKGHGPPASYQENAVRLSASQRSRSTCILPGECSAAVCISKVTVHLHLTRRMQCGCLHLKGHGPPASYQENAVRLSASQRPRSTCILPGECSAAVCISKATVHLHLTRRMQCGCLHLKGHGPPASYQENAVRLSAFQRSRSTCILPGESSAAVCISKVTVQPSEKEKAVFARINYQSGGII
ncbi:UNVERIFIED_CONTAM: hypothetical protein FKN15_013512 [Acipenser sinensis]